MGKVKKPKAEINPGPSSGHEPTTATTINVETAEGLRSLLRELDVAKIEGISSQANPPETMKGDSEIPKDEDEEVTMKNEEAKNFRLIGNSVFKKRQYAKSIASYNKGLKIVPSNIDLLANRSAAYLMLGLYRKALDDCEVVLKLQNEHLKCSCRKVKSLWGLKLYQDALDFLSSLPPNIQEHSDIKQLRAKGNELLTQSQGNIDMIKIMSLPRIQNLEIGEYTGPIIIADVEGKGRGIVATENILPGQLILCSKAFAIIFNDIESSTFKNYICEKIELDENLKNDIFDLHCGSSTPEDNLITRVSEVVERNAFKSQMPTEGTHDGTPSFRGLWILPSYLNHSCISNTYYKTWNDYYFVRAVKYISKGEELTISYWPPNNPARKIGMKQHGFKCMCRLCQFEAEELKSTKIKVERIQSIMQSQSHDLMAKYDAFLELLKLRNGQDCLNMPILSGSIENMAAQFQSQDIQKFIFIAEKMYAVSSSSGIFVESSLCLAMQLCTKYYRLNDVDNAKKWWSKVKDCCMAAYGTLDGLTVPNLMTAHDISLYKRIFD